VELLVQAAVEPEQTVTLKVEVETVNQDSQ
jgi:hypothetical protein